MSDAAEDYWDECVTEAFEQAGLTATEEQIKIVAGDIQVSHENYGMAFHSPQSDGGQREIDHLTRELQAERDKRICYECNGKGRIITQGPCHSSDSECSNCRGEGRI